MIVRILGFGFDSDFPVKVRKHDPVSGSILIDGKQVRLACTSWIMRGCTKDDRFYKFDRTEYVEVTNKQEEE